jgi:hypothetical protein
MPLWLPLESQQPKINFTEDPSKQRQNRGQAPKPPNSINPSHLLVAFKLHPILYTKNSRVNETKPLDPPPPGLFLFEMKTLPTSPTAKPNKIKTLPIAQNPKSKPNSN